MLVNRGSHCAEGPKEDIGLSSIRGALSRMSVESARFSPDTPLEFRTAAHPPKRPGRAQIPIAPRPSSAVSFPEACQTPAPQTRQRLNVTATRQASDNP